LQRCVCILTARRMESTCAARYDHECFSQAYSEGSKQQCYFFPNPLTMIKMRSLSVLHVQAASLWLYEEVEIRGATSLMRSEQFPENSLYPVSFQRHSRFVLIRSPQTGRAQENSFEK